MKGHELTFFYEGRFSRIDAYKSGSEIDRYPCLDSCTNPEHTGYKAHHGSTKFIYACCSCGWKELQGTHIYETESLLRGKLAHLQHQIDWLATPRFEKL